MGFVPVTIVLSQLDRPRRRRRRRRCCRKEHVKIELDLRLNSLVYIGIIICESSSSVWAALKDGPRWAEAVFAAPGIAACFRHQQFLF